MPSRIEVTIEPENSSEEIKKCYGAYGGTGKIEMVNNDGLSEEDREKVRKAPSIDIGKRRDYFVDCMVEEVFKGGYQVVNDHLLLKIEKYDVDGMVQQDLIEFLEDHKGEKAFIRAI